MNKLNFFEVFNENYINRCPISYKNRVWLESDFSLLLDIFKKEKILKKKILIPHYSNFPINYNGDTQTAVNTLKIVAEQMEVQFNKIQLIIYDESVNSIVKKTPGNLLNSTDLEDKSKVSAGLYWGRQADGKFHIGLERSKLTQPHIMVASLAHEVAHIKLIGENKIKVNDEKLTDLTTVILGIGVFNANGAFQKMIGPNTIGWRKIGYLTQMEWGYALSLLAYVREEKTPSWVDYLTLNIKEYFKQGVRFIENNKELIFVSAGGWPNNL